MYYGTMPIMKYIRQRKNILNYRKDCRMKNILQRQFFYSVFVQGNCDSEALDPDVRAFLRYVDGKAAEGVFVQEVDKEVRRVKQHDETRREYMTLAMELKRQRQEGIAEGTRNMILAMLQKRLFCRNYCGLCADIGRVYY